MSGGFDPKPPAEPTTYFIDTVGKSLNNLSNSNIGHFDNK
jgi:hypothetical protein